MSAIHTPWRRLILIGVGITGAICAIVIAFLWPSVFFPEVETLSEDSG